MGVTSDRKAAVKRLRLLTFSAKSSVDSFRKKIDEAFSRAILPNRVERSERDYGGTLCDVLSPEIYSSSKITLYVHGGSFVGGSRASCREFCARLAHKSCSRVVVPELPLAPESQFPAAIESAQAVFRAMFTEEQVALSLDAHGGRPAMPEVAVCAAGSGASIALALLCSLRDRYKSCVSRVALLSPWLDVSPDSILFQPKKISDEAIDSFSMRRAAEAYASAGSLSNPLVSPLKMTDEQLSSFPPVYIQMGGKEILLDDAKKFAARLRALRCECVLDVWPDMPHLFALSDDLLWETHLAIEKIGEVICGRNEKPKERIFNGVIPLESAVNSEA